VKVDLERVLPCYRCGKTMILEIVGELRDQNGEIIIRTIKWICHSCGALKGGIVGG